MKTAIGHSDNVDSPDAIDEVIAQCEEQLDGQTPRGGLLFMTNEYEHSVVLGRLQARWPGLPVIGSSTDGELSSRMGYACDSVCLTLFAGDDLELRAGQGTGTLESIPTAVQQALGCLDGAEPALCILLCPAVLENSSAVVAEVHSQLGERRCPIVGGLSGDHLVSPNTRQFFQGELHQDSLVVLFLCGDLEVSWGVASGWFPIGVEHVVTRSQGSKVFAIDDRPALEIYREFWGDQVNGQLGECPLALKQGAGVEEFILRAAMHIDESEGSVSFAGEVPEGAIVRLTEVLPDGLLAGSERSLRTAAERYVGEAPSIALLFSCAARKWVLGTRTSEEISKLMGVLDQTSAAPPGLAGFYAFGEICPVSEQGPPLVHNETCVTVFVGK